MHIRACGVPPRKFVETFREFGGLKIAAGNVNCPDMNDALQVYDAVVIGGGPAGLTAAIALADAGARTALLARRAPYADNRTTALLGASIDLLERLDVWRRCRDQAARAAGHAPRRRYRPPDPCAGSAVFIGRDRPRPVRLQYRQPLADGGAGRARGRAFRPDPVRRRGGRRSSPTTPNVGIRTAPGPIALGAACGRRRRTALAVPRRRRHRGPSPRTQAVGADLQHRPQPAAQERLDRVSYAVRPMRVRAPARQPLQRGVGCFGGGSRTADGAERRRTVRSRGKAVAFDLRPRPGRARPEPVPAGDRAAAADREKPHRTGRRIRPCGAADRRAGPQSRAARRGRSSPTSQATQSRSAKIPVARRSWRATSRPGAQTS